VAVLPGLHGGVGSAKGLFLENVESGFVRNEREKLRERPFARASIASPIPYTRN